MLAARTNMIDAQIRSADVTDPRIHAAMAAVARERFVPNKKRALAYADVPVEVAPGRFLLDPRSLAKALQLVAVTADDRVLDVACGTGYSSAVLGRLAKSVVALVWVRLPCSVMRRVDAVRTPRPIWIPAGTIVPASDDCAPTRR